ncbi:MAG TPA: hypothetical protein VMD31_01875, partial [Opitutaceae bacterium]|nr:hypothetical protein [Opitutaceae bacterium]
MATLIAGAVTAKENPPVLFELAQTVVAGLQSYVPAAGPPVTVMEQLLDSPGLPVGDVLLPHAANVATATAVAANVVPRINAPVVGEKGRASYAEERTPGSGLRWTAVSFSWRDRRANGGRRSGVLRRDGA